MSRVKRKKSIGKLLAYVYMPVIFLVLGAVIIGISLLPFYSTGQAVINLMFRSQDTVVETMGGLTLNEADIERVEVAAKAQENVRGTMDISQVQWPVDGDQYGKLKCEKVGLDTLIYWGESQEILRNGPGTYKGGGIPGNNRTILIAGHNTMEFASLQNIEMGDIIQFTTTYGFYEYEVTDMSILEATDPNAFDLAQNEEELVLYTCYPFTELGSTTKRFFVSAKRVRGPDLVRTEGANEQ